MITLEESIKSGIHYEDCSSFKGKGCNCYILDYQMYWAESWIKWRKRNWFSRRFLFNEPRDITEPFVK